MSFSFAFLQMDLHSSSSPILTPHIKMEIMPKNMGRSIQNFVSLDSNIEGSLKCLYSTIRAMSDLHIQADRIKRWYA